MCVLIGVYLKRSCDRLLGLIALTISIVHVDEATMAVTTVQYYQANHSVTAGYGCVCVGVGKVSGTFSHASTTAANVSLSKEHTLNPRNYGGSQ